MRAWFSFEGRIRRSRFWLAYVLPLMILSILGTVLDISLGFLVLEDASTPEDGFAFEVRGFGPFTLIGVVLSIWGGLASQVKRWHDRDKSGWWVLVAIIPLVQIWGFIVVGFLRGTDGPNRFGPDPRA